jgi:hypothetical protein
LVSDDNHNIARRYLLGQLTDEEEQNVEERLLSDDDLFQELELTKDELTQEYVSHQLTANEREWLQNHFLISREGEQKHDFAKTFAAYARNHQAQRPNALSFIERFRAFWNAQPKGLQAIAAVAVLVIGVALVWLIRTPAPRSIATLTLTNSPGTRSTNAGPVPSVRREDVLRLTLLLRQPALPDSRYRVELMDDKGVIKTLEVRGQETQSITIDLDIASLHQGPYAVTVSTIDDSGDAQRIPGSYYFILE